MDLYDVLRLSVVGLFATALIGIGVISAAYELILRPHHAFNAQYWHFMQDHIHPKVVFLADSRGVYGLRHTSMDRAFYNYAHFGEYPFGRMLRARHVLRDKPNIRALVLQLDAYTLLRDRGFRPLPQSRAFYESLLFSPRRDIVDVVGASNREFWRNAAAFAFPLAIWWERNDFSEAFRQQMTKIGLNSTPPPSRFLNQSNELVDSTPTFDKQDAAERKQLAVFYAGVRYKTNTFDPLIGKLHLELLADLKARGVAAIGIRMPESAEYLAAARDMIDPATERFISSLDIPILDYREVFADRPDLFTHSDLLADEGARQLSARVAADIRQILDLAPEAAWDCRSKGPLRAKIRPYQPHLARVLGLTTRTRKKVI